MGDEPRFLEGCGPVDPDKARQIAAGASEFHLTCRFPGCNRSATHFDLDHSRHWQFDGLTAHDDLAHLCLGCHALKSETGWQAVHLRDGTLKWTAPTGRPRLGTWSRRSGQASERSVRVAEPTPGSNTVSENRAVSGPALT